MLLRRKSLSNEEILFCSKKITEKLINIIDKLKPKRVHIYIDRENEVKTNFLIDKCISDIELFTPEVNCYKKEIRHKRITSNYSLSKETFDDIENLDIIVVPGVAFNKRCMRLGFGGGFYDRFLSNKNCLKIGVSYDWQIIQKVPICCHDEMLDIVVTEKRIIEQKNYSK